MKNKGKLRKITRIQGLSVFLILLIAVALLLIFPLLLSFSYSTSQYLRYSQTEIAKSAKLNVDSVQKTTEMYQDMITQAATLVLIDSVLNDIAAITKLDQVRESFENYQKIDRAVSLLNSMTYFYSLKIDSIYFYLEGADYILTSDTGATRLANIADNGYLDVFNTLVENPTKSVWTGRKISVQTISGDLHRLVDYITYANISNAIVSPIRGAIFVNIRETIFSNLINSSDFDSEGNTFILDQNGIVLSHIDKTLISTDQSKALGISTLPDMSAGPVSLVIPDADGDMSLFAASYSNKTDWVFVSRHSLDSLMRNIRAMMNKTILVIFLVVLAGSVIIIYMSSRFSIPLKKLIHDISQSGIIVNKRKFVVNEFEYLLESFKQIQSHEAELYESINESRNRLRESQIIDVLRGNTKSSIDPVQVSATGDNGRCFRVLLLSFDGNTDLTQKYSEEQRFYYVSLLCGECERLFSHTYECTAVPVDGNTAVILGYESERESVVPEIHGIIADIQEKFMTVSRTTISAGISTSKKNGTHSLSEAYNESHDALKHRTVEGYGMVREWQNVDNYEYSYPYDAERALLNNLKIADGTAVGGGIDELFARFREMSCDDMQHAVYQLCGVLIIFMKENNLNFFSTQTGEIYTELSLRERLEDKRMFIRDLCGQIVNETKSGAAAMVDKILEYIKQNHKTYIDFEEMSKTLGISYSYMRRLMKDFTGKSIIEHMHSMRIEEAKSLLQGSDVNISIIARDLGYNNIQSFERFFKKYEGISAKDFRKIAT